MVPAWSPLRVALECQSLERVDACTGVRALLDEIEVVAVAPRADAQVVLYLNATERGSDDVVHLRLVGEVAGAPGEYEQLQVVDSREGVDEQREALAPALHRALAPFLAVVIPEAVTVELHTPADPPEERRTRAWGFSVWGGGWGNWTPDYQELSVWTGTSIYRETDRESAGFWVNYDRSVERQPSLRVDGRRVSLAVDSSSVEAGTHQAYNLTDHWAVGVVGRGGHDDPEGQYLWTARAHAGLEHDWFPSDDPRGNRLALAYLLGGQADAYNQRNVLGETRAVFPTHLLLLEGEVRLDTTELGADLAALAELLRPDRRYALSADLNLSVALGDHVDVDLSGGVTQQAVPGPADVDQASFEEVTRASYAEPLVTWGNVNLRLHLDPTNGARNNRFEAASDLDPTGNL